MASTTSPLAIMTGQGSGATVPSGSQNLNPLHSTLISNPNTSPITATLPGAQTGTSTSGLTVPTGIAGAGTTTGGAAGGFGAGVTDPNATTTSAGSKTMLGDFQQTYGQGTGTALANVLGNLGTSTSTAEQNMIGATMQAAQGGYGNILASEGARGVSADSSTAGLAAGDYWGQVSQGIASETGQIGLNEEQTLISALQGEGQAHGSDVSGWDTFGNVMSGIGNAAMGVASLAVPGAGAVAGAAGGGGTIGGALFNKFFG